MEVHIKYKHSIDALTTRRMDSVLVVDASNLCKILINLSFDIRLFKPGISVMAQVFHVLPC
jgi:hypothetical protein